MKDEVEGAVSKKLAEMEPLSVVNEEIIPALDIVGKEYESGKIFLPQLIQSAETTKKAFEIIKESFALKEGEEKGPVMIATVEGDIHDIGKNLVALMLKNYGYRVIDLGKDVSKERIVEAAEEEGAQFIALSALMTTTMMRMKDVVELVKEKQLNVKVIIGGAVITQSFADEIGADGYSKDAADAVKLVQKLCKNA